MNRFQILLALGVLIALLAFEAYRFRKLSSTAAFYNFKMLDDKINDLTINLERTVGDRLDRNHQFMHNSFSSQFDKSKELLQSVSAKLATLDGTNKQVLSISADLKAIQDTMRNPKQRGVMGERQLENVLQNVLPVGTWQMQYKFKNGEIVDGIIKLKNELILPIDSKFSLENYNRILEAKDDEIKNQFKIKFKTDLKLRVDETAKYIRPDEGTMDFAFMFIPSEAIYYDLLINKIGGQNLLEYAYLEKRVIIVSPTSFMAYLQTVLQGLKSLQIEEQAKEIQANVIKLGKHLDTYQDYFKKIGTGIEGATRNYQLAAHELNKIDKDILKIAEKV